MSYHRSLYKTCTVVHLISHLCGKYMFITYTCIYTLIFTKICKLKLLIKYLLCFVLLLVLLPLSPSNIWKFAIWTLSKYSHKQKYHIHSPYSQFMFTCSDLLYNLYIILNNILLTVTTINTIYYQWLHILTGEQCFIIPIFYVTGVWFSISVWILF